MPNHTTIDLDQLVHVTGGASTDLPPSKPPLGEPGKPAPKQPPDSNPIPDPIRRFFDGLPQAPTKRPPWFV